MLPLSNQLAVVTGAGSGVGRAIVLGLANQGAKLCLLGRTLERLEAVAEQARSHNTWAKCYQIDLVSEKEIKDFAVQLRRDAGQVDILIHSAGIIFVGPLAQATVEDFNRQYQVNLRAPFVLTQALLPMMKSCQGQIVFINSSVGLNARAHVGQYAATKHGLKGIADSLREEVNPNGLRVLSVFLGRTASPMQAAVHQTEGKDYHPEHLIQPEDVSAVVINTLCLPRSAEVTDINIRPLKKQ
jgi:NADP-dependent 3-hydroxy acid dehydrogenase YdfG